MKHADVIKHMAEHGFESVEYGQNDNLKPSIWATSSLTINPVIDQGLQWRIKPATLRINVEIPMPCSESQAQAALWLGKNSQRNPIYFKSQDDCDEAKRILVAALRGEK